MLGLAAGVDISPGWLPGLGLRGQSLSGGHHLLDSFEKANDLGKQPCLTWTCVGVAVNCKHIPMCGLHGELYSGVIHRQKGRNESEMTAQSIIRPRPVVHVCPTIGTTMLGLLTKALHPANLPQLAKLHVEISSNDFRHAIRVREVQDLRHFDLSCYMSIVSFGKIHKYHCQS